MEDENGSQFGNRDEILQPSILWSDLGGGWIGLGAALNWIAMRGQPMSVAQFHILEDEAERALVSTLADLPAAKAEALVRGAREDEPGLLTSIPSGIWRQTATSDANDVGQPYRMIGMDDDDEWEGAIYGLRIPGFRRVQIRADFIRKTWPEHRRDIKQKPVYAAVSQAQIRRLIEKIAEITPPELAPLTQAELRMLVTRCLPNATRDIVIQIAKEILPTQRRGPRTPRNPHRPEQIRQLSDKLLAGQLDN